MFVVLWWFLIFIKINEYIFYNFFCFCFLGGFLYFCVINLEVNLFNKFDFLKL